MLFVSGTSPSPVTPADRAKGTPAVYGDTRAQAVSVLGKIETTLKEQGLTMGDVVMMHVYLVADPANGKMDFAGMNAGFTQFFGTEVDFGFSKTKEESFTKWTHQRVLYDAVRAIRLFRPLPSSRPPSGQPLEMCSSE